MDVWLGCLEGVRRETEREGEYTKNRWEKKQCK